MAPFFFDLMSLMSLSIHDDSRQMQKHWIGLGELSTEISGRALTSAKWVATASELLRVAGGEKTPAQIALRAHSSNFMKHYYLLIATSFTCISSDVVDFLNRLVR